MSRGHGAVQRFVLAELATAGGEPPGHRWISVDSLGRSRVHQRLCAEGDHRRCDTWREPEPTRAETESIRRAVKALARDGLVETRQKRILTQARHTVRRANRVYADDRRRVDADRWFLQCRFPLSDDERQQEAEHQRLERRQADERLMQAWAELMRASA